MSNEPLVPSEYICPSITDIKIDENIVIDSFSDQIVSFGSCFASNITIMFKELGFNSHYSYYNCFHYTARSLEKLLLKWKENDFEPRFENNDFYALKDSSSRYTSLYHHRMFDIDLEKLKNHVAIEDRLTIERLKKAKIIFLTLGNATYVEMKDGHSVNYAGGIDKNDYNIKFSTVSEIKNELKSIIDILQLINNNFYLIVTISPQRYAWHITMDRHNKKYNEYIHEISSACNNEKWGGVDSLVHSNLDKAKLRVAIDEVLMQLNSYKYFYFPSYDIVMDELRLYETFSNNVYDNLHINSPHTSNYVINKFLNHSCTEDVKKALKFYRDEIRYKGRLTRLLDTYKFNIDLIRENASQIIEDIMPTLVKTKAIGIIDKVNCLLEKYNISLVPNKNNLINIIDSHILNNTYEKVYVYGAGETSEKILSKSCVLNSKLFGFIDSSKDKINTLYFARLVYELKDVSDEDTTLIVIASEKFHLEIENKLNSSLKKCKILNPWDVSLNE